MKNDHLFIDAPVYRYRGSIPWRDLPERFGDFHLIHMRHNCWEKTVVWKRMFQDLTKHADNEYAMVDPTIKRARQHSAGTQKRWLKPDDKS